MKGTHKLHAFIPVSNGVLRVSRHSDRESQTPYDIVNVTRSPTSAAVSRALILHSSLNIGNVNACIHDSRWWLGLVLDLNDENGVNLNFTNECGPMSGFSWNKKNQLFIPIENVLLKLDQPQFRTRSKRNFGVTEEQYRKIVNEFELHQSSSTR